MADKNALLPQKEMAVFSWRSKACDSVQEMRSNPGMNTGCWGRTQPRPEPHSFPKVTLKLRPERGGKWILKRKKMACVEPYCQKQNLFRKSYICSAIKMLG